MPGQITCPLCKSVECRRSRRRGPVDYLLATMGNYPWRCRKCETRFRVWKIQPTHQFVAHCPRCGNVDLERVARKRVEGGFIIAMERRLNFPAYRCDPCRHKFFSLRPYRPSSPRAEDKAEAASSASAALPEARESRKGEPKPAKKTP